MAQPLTTPVKNRPSFRFRSQEDKKLSEEIDADVYDMEQYAKPAREFGKEAIQGYMALSMDSRQNNNRSRLFPQVLHGIVYSRIAMEAANLYKVEYKSRKASSKPKMKFLNACLRHSEEGDNNLRPHAFHLWHHQNFDKVLLGLGARYQSYLLQTREVRITGDDGKPKTKTMIVHDDIWDEVIDFFHFGVSRDTLPGMFQGSRCYFDKFFPRAAFDERFGNNPFYQDTDKVPEDDWYQGDSDYMWPVHKNMVRVRYYFDLYRDLMAIKANGVLIRKDYIRDYGDPRRPKKFLPISTIHNDIGYEMADPAVPTIIQAGRAYADVGSVSTNRTFWTMGDAFMVKGLVGLKRSLWRAGSDHIKAASVHFLLARSAGVLDQIRTADLYGIVPLKTDTETNSFDVKSLTENSTFMQQFADADENIDNMISYILGNDWRRAATEMTNEKATVAAIRQQVQRLRMSQNSKFNEGAVQRHYAIRLNLIQQYYPEPTEMPVDADTNLDDIDEQDVIRDADGRPVAVKKYKEIGIDEPVVEIKRGGNFRLVTPDHPDARKAGKMGDSTFKSRGEFIRTEEEPIIDTEPGSTFAELKALEQSLENEKIQSYQPFFTLLYSDENGGQAPLVPKEGAEELLRKHAEVYGDDPDKILPKQQSSDIQEAMKMPPPFQKPKPQPLPGMPTQTSPQQPPAPGISPMNAKGARMTTATLP